MDSNGQTRISRRKQKNTKNKPMWKRIMKIALIAILVIGIGVGALFTYYIATAPKIDAAKLSDPFSSVLLDIDGNEFADLEVEQRTKRSEEHTSELQSRF